MKENFCPVADHFDKVVSVIVFSDGNAQTFEKGDPAYEAILKSWGELLAEARQMPAFGVSIDSLTREEMKKGLWVEFIFDGKQMCENMPFESLLAAVKAPYRGLNIVRNCGGMYQGRCFYIDLGEKDMSAFEAALMKTIANK